MLLIMLCLHFAIQSEVNAQHSIPTNWSGSLPFIITQPASIVNACPGSSPAFSVIATGINLTYQWHTGVPPSGLPISGATEPVFIIGSASLAHAGSYYVVISNAFGQVTSSVATLTLPAPLFSGGHNTVLITACTNYNPDKLTFTKATSGGKLPYGYQWQSALPATGPWTDITGANTASYDPPNLITEGMYGYRCAVSDSCGTVENTAPKLITIVPDPSVTVTGGGVICQNSAAILTSFVMNGTGAISYQWVSSLNGFNGWAPIAGATAPDFSIPTIIPGIVYYRVRVDASGAACSKPYSAVILVMVIPDHTPPTFQPPAGPFNFCVENIMETCYWSPFTGINPERPDYYIFRKGDQYFDLDPNYYNDNCQTGCDLPIRWQITVNVEAFVSGNGQPSAHDDFEIPGSPNAAVTHEITWWITDCNGNESLPETRNIVIKPRPKIIIN